MDTRSEQSSTPVSESTNSATTIPCGVDVLVEQDGNWYTQISIDEAFDIRFDVQLYWSNGVGIVKTWTPSMWREGFAEGSCPEATSISSWWYYVAPFYILVDSPTKPEYVCEQ